MYVVKIAHAVIEHIPHKSRNVCHGIYTSRAIKITVSGIDTLFTEKKCYFLMPVCLLTEGLCYICRMQFWLQLICRVFLSITVVIC